MSIRRAGEAVTCFEVVGENNRHRTGGVLAGAAARVDGRPGVNMAALARMAVAAADAFAT